jgi:hypothetical protein
MKPEMKPSDPPRRLPVNLHEVAFLASQSEEFLDPSAAVDGFVDTRTGAVHSLLRDALRCVEEGEDREDYPDIPEEEFELAETILADREERFQKIERWHSSEAFELMEEFAGECGDPRLRQTLLEALRGPKPFRRFKDALLDWPEARETWFSFQEHRHREWVRDWLEQFGIEAEDASTYNPGPVPESW